MKGLLSKVLSLNMGTKLSLTFALLIALTSVPLSFIIVSYSKKTFYNGILNSVRESLMSEELQLRNHIINRDYWSLFKLVKSLSEKSYVREAVVIDGLGKVLAHSDPQKHPIGSSFGRAGDVEFRVRGFNKDIGKVVVFLDREMIAESFRPIRLFLMASALPFSAVSVLLGFFISYRIRSRLLRIKDSMRKVREGSLKGIERVEFWEKDELQEFSDFLFETISRLKSYHDNLEYAQSFYKNLLDTINELVMVTDQEGKILYANRKIEALGFSMDDLLGLGIENIVEDREGADFSSYREVKVKGKNGSFPALMSVSPVGEWKIISLVDISERKLMEEKLRKMEILSSLGEMSASFAHELKNTMLPLKLLSSVDHLTEEDMEVIRRCIGKADRLVNTFLNFARPTSAEVTKLHLAKVVGDVLFFLEAKIKEKRVNLRKEVENNNVFTNREMLETILINLLSNAVDAVDEGGEVGIRAFVSEGILNVEVWDRGKGIPKEDIDRVFNPFYTTKNSGTGLGLAIVMRNVYLLKGSVEVMSEEGKGTTFKVYIPCRGQEDEGKNTAGGRRP